MQSENPVSTNSCHGSHQCPWWLGWLLVCGARRWLENPQALVTPLIAPGHRVLEVGPGMGYFTLPMAEKVGPEGRVYCVEVQPKMLAGLVHRVERRGLGQRVEARGCTTTDLGIADLAGTIDVAVLIHVLHEIEDPSRALGAIARALRPNGRLLLIEPKGHVTAESFQSELEMAHAHGLRPVERPPVAGSRKHRMAVLSR